MRQFIKQPNGNYCVFCTALNDFIIFDATKEELTKILIDEQIKNITERINTISKSLDVGEQTYESSMTYQEAIDRIIEVYGDEALEGYNKYLESKLTRSKVFE